MQQYCNLLIFSTCNPVARYLSLYLPVEKGFFMGQVKKNLFRIFDR
jgi:hypothetical protein